MEFEIIVLPVGFTLAALAVVELSNKHVFLPSFITFTNF